MAEAPILPPGATKLDLFLINQLAVPGTVDFGHMRTMEEAERMLQERDAGKHPSLAPSESPPPPPHDLLAAFDCIPVTRIVLVCSDICLLHLARGH